MQRCDLSQDLLKEFLHYNPESGVFTWKFRDRKWFKSYRSFKVFISLFEGKNAGSVHTSKNKSYNIIKILTMNIKAHRLAWLYMKGHWPIYQIDHENGNGLDNRIVNLRDVPQKANAKNSKLRKKNNTGVMGVFYREKRNKPWIAHINNNEGNKISKGFATRPQAMICRKIWEKEFNYHPNHGRLM